MNDTVWRMVTAFLFFLASTTCLLYLSPFDRQPSGVATDKLDGV